MRMITVLPRLMPLCRQLQGSYNVAFLAFCNTSSGKMPMVRYVRIRSVLLTANRFNACFSHYRQWDYRASHHRTRQKIHGVRCQRLHYHLFPPMPAVRFLPPSVVPCSSAIPLRLNSRLVNVITPPANEDHGNSCCTSTASKKPVFACAPPFFAHAMNGEWSEVIA